MNTTQSLARIGLTVEQARTYIMANLDKPVTLYYAAKQYKIDSQMLADIVQDRFPGVSATQVEAFFSSYGLRGKDLNAATLNPAPVVKSWQGDSKFKSLFSFNDNTGVLSTESMRDTVVAKVGWDKYIQTFSPKNIPGAADGVLSVADLGFSQLGDFAATWQNMESLLYGTISQVGHSLSRNEAQEIYDFTQKNSFWIQIKNPGVMAQFEKLMLDALLDPATEQDPAVLSDDQIADAITNALISQVSLVGIDTSQNLFSNINVF